MKRKTYKMVRKLKQAAVAVVGFFALSQTGCSMPKHDVDEKTHVTTVEDYKTKINDTELNENDKQQIARVRNTYGKVKVSYIEYQVDTVADSKGVLAHYSPEDNAIIINYDKNRKSENELAQSDYVKIHEYKHYLNLCLGVHEAKVSPEQAYKLSMHDEISANLYEFLLMRQKYLKNGDITIFYKENEGKFAFYANAVKQGKIKPGATDEDGFNQEMFLIANGIKHRWCEKFGHDKFYQEGGLFYVRRYSDSTNEYAAYHDPNYQKVLHRIYTISGIDFSQYFANDIELDKNEKDKIWRETEEAKMDKQFYSHEQVTEILDVLPYDKSISLQQYGNYVKNKMAMEMFLEADEGVTQSVEDFAQDVMFMYKMSQDKRLPKELRENANAELQFLKNDFAESCDRADRRFGSYEKYAVESAARKQSVFAKDNDEKFNDLLAKLYVFQIKDDVREADDGTLIHIGGELDLRQILDCSSMQYHKQDNFEQTLNLGRVGARETSKNFTLGDPRYRTWAPVEGQRVSKVIGGWLPDLTDFIKQPELTTKFEAHKKVYKHPGDENPYKEQPANNGTRNKEQRRGSSLNAALKQNRGR